MNIWHRCCASKRQLFAIQAATQIVLQTCVWATEMLLHDSASTLGGTCMAIPAFSVHCLPDWETQVWPTRNNRESGTTGHGTVPKPILW